MWIAAAFIRSLARGVCLPNLAKERHLERGPRDIAKGEGQRRGRPERARILWQRAPRLHSIKPPFRQYDAQGPKSFTEILATSAEKPNPFLFPIQLPVCHLKVSSLPKRWRALVPLPVFRRYRPGERR